MKDLNYNVNDVDLIVKSGVWAWHGTNTELGLKLITKYGLDPYRRGINGQKHGAGEYFANFQNPSVSYENYANKTGNLILFFLMGFGNDKYKEGVDVILKKEISSQLGDIYVLNNPKESENILYCVPVMIVPINDHQSIDVLDVRQPYNWEWQDDSGWVYYGKGQREEFMSQYIINSMNREYLRKICNGEFVLEFIRLRDGKTDSYTISLNSRTQTNNRTNYKRNIRDTHNPRNPENCKIF